MALKVTERSELTCEIALGALQALPAQVTFIVGKPKPEIITDLHKRAGVFHDMGRVDIPLPIGLHGPSRGESDRNARNKALDAFCDQLMKQRSLVSESTSRSLMWLICPGVATTPSIRCEFLLMLG